MATNDVTQLIERCREGDATAFDALLEAVYGELRRLAAYHMRDARPGHTLQPTALVHEAYLKLVRGADGSWKDRAHFFAAAAQAMRHILVDHARARATDKRAGDAPRVPLDEAVEAAVSDDVDLVALHEALDRLSAVDPEAGRIVELRYFGGLTVPEVAEVLGVSRATVEREWAAARAWLRAELGP
jgi:RNA polymerase sigma-70 factor, ECF subfamily